MVPEDVDSNVDPYRRRPGSEESVVSPIYEIGVALGPRVYQNGAKNKEVYLAVEFFGGTLRGYHHYVGRDQEFGRILREFYFQNKENAVYVGVGIGPSFRIRPIRNLAITGNVVMGYAGQKYRQLSNNNWQGIWQARASLRAELVF
jgi:hypothetical protein